MSVLKDLSDAMGAAVKAVSPSIVQVNARRRLPATGIVWSEDGVIVTSSHVVQRDEEITITLEDGSTHDAELIGRDNQNDLAVLKVTGEVSLTPANWGTEDALKVGNLVLALGRPGEQVQATLGVVSALVENPIEARERARKRLKRENG
ncbi:MAG: trypsin-like peptidase domain-containing protein, partial [Chloroflexota bacterium]